MASQAPSTFSLLLVVSLVLFTVQESLVPVVGGETDFWWHLAAGQRLWQGHFDILDPYSFVYDSKRWIHIDWLFQALIYPLYSLGGVGGVLLGRAVVHLFTVAVLWRSLHRNQVSAIWRWALCMATVSIWGSGIALRPATLSIAFTVLFLHLLEQARRGERRCLRHLPWLLCLWYNFHVAALAGCLMVGLYAVGCWLEKPWKGTRDWFLCLMGCSLAPFLNPQGWLTVYHPLELLWSKSPWNQVILEVQRPDWDWSGTATARLLIFLAGLEALWCLRQRRWTTVLVVLIFGYLSWTNYRHQFQFCAVLAYFGGSLSQRWAHLSRLRGVVRVATPFVALAVCARCLLCLALTAWPPSGLLRQESFSESVVQALAEAPPGLRIFTDMNSAGYYIWRTQGRQRIFLDSRTSQVFDEPNLIGAYFEILLDRPQALALLEKFRVDVVAENRLSTGNPSLYQKLARHPDWTLVYSDSTGSLLCRKEVSSQIPPPRGRAFLRGYELAHEAQLRGEALLATQLYQDSLRNYPQFASAHLELARLALGAGNHSEARRQLALAELFNPALHSPELWRQLGFYPPNGALLAWALPFLALGPVAK